MKRKYKILILSYYSLGLFIAGGLAGCGDKYLDPYPWIVGSQEEVNDSDGEEGLGATDISVLEAELKGAIPEMITYQKAMSTNISVLIPLIIMPDIGQPAKTILHSVVRYLHCILIRITIWVVHVVIPCLYKQRMRFSMQRNWVNPNGVRWH